MKKQEKIFAVQDLSERLKLAKTIVLVDYRGLTVPQISELRALIKKVGGQLLVVKNTLLGRALKEQNLPPLESTGPTAVVFAYEDEISPLKTIFDFAKNQGLPSFKSGIWEDKVLTKEDLEKLGTLPGRQELVGNLLGLLSSPTARLVRILKGNPQKLILILKSKPSFAKTTEGKGGEN